MDLLPKRGARPRCMAVTSIANHRGFSSLAESTEFKPGALCVVSCDFSRICKEKSYINSAFPDF
jgi:hypothetical protein